MTGAVGKTKRKHTEKDGGFDDDVMMIAPPSPPKFAFLSLMTSTARIVVAVGGYYAPVRLIDGHNACGPYTHPPSLIATLHPATGTTTVYTYKKEADVCLFRSKCKCESTTSTAFKKICITEKNTVNRVKKKKKNDSNCNGNYITGATNKKPQPPHEAR